jgi:hypothetical protein
MDLSKYGDNGDWCNDGCWWIYIDMFMLILFIYEYGIINDIDIIYECGIINKYKESNMFVNFGPSSEFRWFM